MKKSVRKCPNCRTEFESDSNSELIRECPVCLCHDSVIIGYRDTELADRFNNGKPQWSMVDFKSLEDMVRVLEFGEKKYSRDNWKKGLKTTEVVDSLLRHIYAYLNGEDIDPESGINHTGHIMCNAMFLSHMHLFRKDMDTRCKTLSKE